MAAVSDGCVGFRNPLPHDFLSADYPSGHFLFFLFFFLSIRLGAVSGSATSFPLRNVFLVGRFLFVLFLFCFIRNHFLWDFCWIALGAACSTGCCGGSLSAWGSATAPVVSDYFCCFSFLKRWLSLITQLMNWIVGAPARFLLVAPERIRCAGVTQPSDFMRSKKGGEEEEEEEEGKEGGIKEKTNGINLKSNVARSVARLLHPFSLSIEFFISDFCFDLCILPARTLTFRHSMSPPSLPSPPLPPPSTPPHTHADSVGSVASLKAKWKTIRYYSNIPLLAVEFRFWLLPFLGSARQRHLTTKKKIYLYICLRVQKKKILNSECETKEVVVYYPTRIACSHEGHALLSWL